MNRREVLGQIISIPAAATLASCAAGNTAASPKTPAPASPAPSAPSATPKINDLTGRHGARVGQWPAPPVTSYTTEDADDLEPMPERPALLDFLKHRLVNAQHLLYCADWARKQDLPEQTIFACLLHDIGLSVMRPDHGFWGAQLVAPYVDERVSWAILHHQFCRFFADASVGYKGPPEQYNKFFGPDFKPEPYIQTGYAYARKHRWYMKARLITMSEQETPMPMSLYTDKVARPVLNVDEFTDIIGRNFKQPKEGLGHDNSSTATHVADSDQPDPTRLSVAAVARRPRTLRTRGL